VNNRALKVSSSLALFDVPDIVNVSTGSIDISYYTPADTINDGEQEAEQSNQQPLLWESIDNMTATQRAARPTNLRIVTSDWLVHDGNVHYSRDMRMFDRETYRELRGVFVDIPSIGRTAVRGIGTVQLRLRKTFENPDVEIIVKVPDCLHIPSALCNGYSMVKAKSSGLSCHALKQGHFMFMSFAQLDSPQFVGCTLGGQRRLYFSGQKDGTGRIPDHPIPAGDININVDMIKVEDTHRRTVEAERVDRYEFERFSLAISARGTDGDDRPQEMDYMSYVLWRYAVKDSGFRERFGLDEKKQHTVVVQTMSETGLAYPRGCNLCFQKPSWGFCECECTSVGPVNGP
jgi:hypothetical protein